MIPGAYFIESLFAGSRLSSGQALSKLDMLHAAQDIRTLSTLPGNRLERLKEDRKGQFSIRVNDQWRVCFEWRDGHAYEVEIVDYH